MCFILNAEMLHNYCPQSNANELNVINTIDTAFKNDDKNLIDSAHKNLLVFLKDKRTIERLHKALSASIKEYDRSFTGVLNFFEKSFEKHKNKKRKNNDNFNTNDNITR